MSQAAGLPAARPAAPCASQRPSSLQRPLPAAARPQQQQQQPGWRPAERPGQQRRQWQRRRAAAPPPPAAGSAAAEPATVAASRANPAPTDVEYDAVIIGSGMGGLSTAAQLAAKGAKVVVLEK